MEVLPAAGHKRYTHAPMKTTIIIAIEGLLSSSQRSINALQTACSGCPLLSWALALYLIMYKYD